MRVSVLRNTRVPSSSTSCRCSPTPVAITPTYWNQTTPTTPAAWSPMRPRPARGLPAPRDACASLRPERNEAPQILRIFPDFGGELEGPRIVLDLRAASDAGRSRRARPRVSPCSFGNPHAGLGQALRRHWICRCGIWFALILFLPLHGENRHGAGNMFLDRTDADAQAARDFGVTETVQTMHEKYFACSRSWRDRAHPASSSDVARRRKPHLASDRGRAARDFRSARSRKLSSRAWR